MTSRSQPCALHLNSWSHSFISSLHLGCFPSSFPTLASLLTSLTYPQSGQISCRIHCWLVKLVMMTHMYIGGMSKCINQVGRLICLFFSCLFEYFYDTVSREYGYQKPDTYHDSDTRSIGATSSETLFGCTSIHPNTHVCIRVYWSVGKQAPKRGGVGGVELKTFAESFSLTWATTQWRREVARARWTGGIINGQWIDDDTVVHQSPLESSGNLLSHTHT